MAKGLPVSFLMPNLDSGKFPPIVCVMLRARGASQEHHVLRRALKEAFHTGAVNARCQREDFQESSDVLCLANEVAFEALKYIASEEGDWSYSERAIEVEQLHRKHFFYRGILVLLDHRPDAKGFTFI
jgi:hypothetical protein